MCIYLCFVTKSLVIKLMCNIIQRMHCDIFYIALSSCIYSTIFNRDGFECKINMRINWIVELS